MSTDDKCAKLEKEHRRLNQEISAAIIAKMSPGAGIDAVSEVFCRISRIRRLSREQSSLSIFTINPDTFGAAKDVPFRYTIRA